MIELPTSNVSGGRYRGNLPAIIASGKNKPVGSTCVDPETNIEDLFPVGMGLAAISDIDKDIVFMRLSRIPYDHTLGPPTRV